MYLIFSAFSHAGHLPTHQKLIHATQKDWICDCCGSRFGIKGYLKSHMLTHLPPSFACSKCFKKFVHAGELTIHLKRHAGILNEVCKICNKGHSTKKDLANHIKCKHFYKLHCEITNCSYKSSSKSNFKRHLKAAHKHLNQNMIEKLLKNLEFLKADFQKMKYV